MKLNIVMHLKKWWMNIYADFKADKEKKFRCEIKILKLLKLLSKYEKKRIPHKR